jgi:hypothetical protein
MKGIPEFSFKLRLTPKRSIIAVLVASILAFVATKCDISKEELLKLYNEIRKVIPLNGNGFFKEFDNQLNQRIINDPKLLDYKVRKEVDQSIREYERLTGDYGTVKIPSPRYSEKPIDNSVCYTEECKSLGGEMRICAPWVDNCSGDVVK